MMQQIIELNPFDCLPPPDNRAVTTEDVLAMAASFRANGGQLQPAIVCVHPELPDKQMLLDGFIRNETCKLLGLKLKAVKVDRPFTKAEQAKLRLTANVIRKAMSPLEVANDIMLFIKEEGCTQTEAGEKIGLPQPTVSKYLTVRNLPEDLRQLILDKKLDFNAAYAVATLPTLEMKREAARKIVEGGLKKDDAIALVNSMKGKKQPKQPKKKKFTISFELPPVNAAAALVEHLKTLIARLNKLGDIPPDALAAVLS
ncbi:ParB N-terminal domain-containing protein [Gemmata sp. G18]|uniref:ParB N-terminal domain-containing protein n=1 Tax=Gemmata palustris TaxID=2822762 RepID=A0ABS5BXG8_9BACT|nr:ParB N-terminal domain-containing protein [Gemmata palustris]MBP3958406.1 ParB N-terminal domain-containing protein [Gemmata palustris]